MKVQRRSTVIISGIAVVLAAIIGGGIAIGGGNDSPVAATATSAPTTTTASPVGSPAATSAPVVEKAAEPAVEIAPAVRKAKPAGELLDRFGWGGSVRLGATYNEVKATGLLGASDDVPGWCTEYPVVVATTVRIQFTESLGAAVIWAEKGVSTPEGIQLGSTVAELRAAYPDLREGPNGFSVVFHDAGTFYYFGRSEDGKVNAMSVNRNHQTCYN